MTTMAIGQSEGTWSITTRVIVYAAIGAALYAVFNFISFGIAVPWSNEVSVRPHYGLLTFFGFAFGPIVGFLTGFVGNVLGDQLSNYGPSLRGSGASPTGSRASLPGSSRYGWQAG